MKHLLALLSLLFAATPLLAQDLTKVDRALAKEPAYQSKQPKYCLLVFGPDATHRVWLVQDGGLLYVDRNGNGDLTEAGEKVEAAKGEYTNDPKEGIFHFQTGDIAEGKLSHKNLAISVNLLRDLAGDEVALKEHAARHPKAHAYSLGMDVEMPGYQSVGLGGRVRQFVSYADPRGAHVWGDSPQTAPVLHLRGPLQMLPYVTLPRLTMGRKADIILAMGTPGVGPGTTAYVGYEGVAPEKAHPVMEITYPPQRPGEPPLKERYELKERC